MYTILEKTVEGLSPLTDTEIIEEVKEQLKPNVEEESKVDDERNINDEEKSKLFDTFDSLIKILDDCFVYDFSKIMSLYNQKNR